jgi:hypothetical protein
MTVAPSIDPARFLHDHLEQASPDLLRDMLTTFINTLLSADADAVCGAAYGTVSDDRINRRNGYTGTVTSTPARERSMSRFRSCGRAPTSPIGYWSAAAARNGP